MQTTTTKFKKNEVKESTTALSVALLVHDLKDAKELGDVFRKMGIIPHFYEDLRGFWYGTLESLPSLCIVDVRKMTEGELLLKNHPFVKAQTMPLAFFYGEDTKPLLYSTYELYHLGAIERGPSYSGPLKALLKRLNRQMELERGFQSENLDRTTLEGKLEKVVARHEELKEKQFYSDYLKSLVTQFEMNRAEGDFLTVVCKVFDTRHEFSEYSLVELSKNGQKTISPPSEGRKYRTLPPLWLGKTCNSGLEVFAQNMVSQVALELMGGQLMSILIRGKADFPEQMLLLKVEDEGMLTHLDWELLESYLGTYAASLELKEMNDVEKKGRVLSSWELFESFDQALFGRRTDEMTALTRGGRQEEWNLIGLSFKSLLEVIEAKSERRFHWQSFFKEFFSRFDSQVKEEFYLCPIFPGYVLMAVSKDRSDDVFKHLKSFAMRFPLWKYFDDVDVVWSYNLKPEVRMVPFGLAPTLEALKEAFGESAIVREVAPAAKAKGEASAQVFSEESELDTLIWGRREAPTL